MRLRIETPLEGIRNVIPQGFRALKHNLINERFKILIDGIGDKHRHLLRLHRPKKLIKRAKLR